jgi:hypothetical protein
MLSINGPSFLIKTRVNLSKAEADSRASYTLMLVGPDPVEPTNADKAFFRHWLIPGLEPLASGMVAETKFALTPYRGPELEDECVPPKICPT